MHKKDKKLILIAGPTAAGKTSLAMEVARQLQTEIISADSRQCFNELNIGVAKPSSAELLSIRHYFINSHSIHEDVNAAAFEQLAIQWVEEIFKTSDVAIMVGGTGLYIKAFCEGLDEIPEIPATIRNEIQNAYKARGISWLQDSIRELDPAFFEKGEIHNPRRMMRALEVRLATGRSLHSFRREKPKSRNFLIQKFGITLPKELLHRNINTRVDHMMEMGLLEEVKKLYAHRSLNALQTVGYSELFSYLDGQISLDYAIELIRKNTRQYAKRQLTWFRKDSFIQWIGAGEWEKIIKS